MRIISNIIDRYRRWICSSSPADNAFRVPILGLNIERSNSNMDNTILKLINEKTIGTIDDKALYQMFVDMNGGYYASNDATVSVYNYRYKCFVTIRKSSFLAKMGSHSYQRQSLESFILHEANLLRKGGETK